jgi:hypothetical protein
MIDELVEFMTGDDFVYRHKWAKGDLLMWDNRCTLHTGTLYDDTKYFRTMHRLWVKGDKPSIEGSPYPGAVAKRLRGEYLGPNPCPLPLRSLRALRSPIGMTT